MTGVRLTHEFSVPVSVDAVWTRFTTDLASVAGCFPGATVTSADEDGFEGVCRIKVGPITLVYKGAGSVVHKDPSTRTVRVEAHGRDRRGNGTAGADVTASIAAVEDGTAIELVTEVTVTGKPAEFGRGVMREVSDELLQQFVQRLQAMLGSEEAAFEEVAGAAESGPGRASDGDRGSAAVTSSEDALDLGTAVLPVLVRMYGKPVAVAGAVVGAGLLLWRVLRRRS